MNLELFSHFYFLNMNITLDIWVPVMNLYTGSHNIHLEGSCFRFLILVFVLVLYK